jgi:hypothetical protein
MRDRAELADLLDPLRLRVAAIVRRVVVTLTSKVSWQVKGFDSPAGTNVFSAEIFPGIGFYARPPAKGGKVEAVVVNVGADAGTPAIVGTRDEATRAAVDAAIGGFKDDESGVFNTKSIVRVKADGTIEARSIGGAAVALATKADVDALAAYVAKQFDAAAGHKHVVAGAATTTITTGTAALPAPTLEAPPAAAGTSKLKGE